LHGIVDSMWLKKLDATDEEYEQVCKKIEEELGLPISFEGRYKWIVFLNSRVNPKVPVLNRYYGVFQDGALKVRGIDLRRHDTPEIVRKCQADMLNVLSKASNSSEFMALIPQALKVMKFYATMLRTDRVPMEELVIEKRLSKTPNEYKNLVSQAIAARQLVKEGQAVHAGQSVNYVITRNESRIDENRAMAMELVENGVSYDSEAYVQLVLSSAMNLLLPFGYDLDALRNISANIDKR
jgi:DNA polymerase I